MSDDTIPEAAPASHDPGTATPVTPAGDTERPEPHQPNDREPGIPASGNGGARPAAKRRRRGSRGGRNRKKRPAAGRVDAGDATPGPDDRGLTSEDVAATAREDAGLEETGGEETGGEEAGGEEVGLDVPKPRIGDRRPAPAPAPAAAERPRIGDTRPAPTAPEPTGRSRRRRRRTRGRGREAQAEPRRAADDVVHADLGIDDEAETAELDDSVRRRRRGRTRKGRPAGRYLMCVHLHPGGATHIAVLEGRSLVEHTVRAPTDVDMSIDGNIYLGRVQNVLPGMEAAFVDIGTPKNGVLYRGDVAYDANDVEASHPRIERLLKNGQSVLVQVTKNPIGAKGARLTQEVSLAGRFVVMVPGQAQTYGISKRLPDDERRRLRRALDGLRPPDAGLIVRTAAEGATPEELARDIERLRSQWEQISALAGRSKPGRVVYQEPPLVLRIIREEFTKEYRGIVIDERELYENVKAYVEAVAPELADRVEFYDEAEEGLPLYERFHVSEQLLKALDRKVWLPSGGSVVIERTEALTVIDVNTGKNVGRSNLEETVFQNNLEAADEIARQLRLRDIGGIIVIDFIDMEIKRNREAVMNAFREALARDKTRTQVFEISELGLVEMTRKRISEGLLESFSTTCPTCNGRGILLDEDQLQGVQ